MSDQDWREGPGVTKDEFFDDPDPDLQLILDTLNHLKVRLDPHVMVQLGDAGVNVNKVTYVTGEEDGSTTVHLDRGLYLTVDLSVSEVIRRLNGEEAME